VRPGGVLAVTVWGPGVLEPATAAFWDAVGAERPDLVGGFQPWTRVTDPAGLSQLLQRGGVADPIVEAEPGIHPLADPEDWWTRRAGHRISGHYPAARRGRGAAGTGRQRPMATSA
jgi:hypothetical protein